MLRKLCAGSAMLSLCLGSATPALAQDYRFAGQDGPQGANATLNLRVPFGPTARQSRATFGLTFAFGRRLGLRDDGLPVVRQMRFADFRFSDADTGFGLRNARIAGFDLANPGRDRWNFSGPQNKSALMYMAAALGISIAACIAIDCLGDSNSDEEEESTPPNTSNPG